MNILVRCDSSNVIGTGHIMRCLNLCEYYPENTYTFVCRNYNLNISQKILDASHRLILLDYCIEPELNKYKSWIGCTLEQELEELIKIISEKKYDQIIIDHYGIDWIIEKELYEYTNKLIVISDIFEYKHLCNEFINYNSDDIELLKKLNLNPNTIIKCGSEHVIINKKFKEYKKTLFRHKIEKMCIMLGGSDPFNYTLQILQQMHNIIINNQIQVYVIIGKANGNVDSIVEFTQKSSNYILLFDINYDQLIQLYLDIDLCIGSLSITAYERLYLNVPQICIKIVDNQNIQQLQEFNICKINDLKNKIEFIYNMNNIYLKNILLCNSNDQESVRIIRNTLSIKNNMYSDHDITFDEHFIWIKSLETNSKQKVFIIYKESEVIGIISVNNYDKIHKKTDWAFYVDEKQRGGIGKALEFFFINYMFNILNVEKINCEVIETNNIVVNMHKNFCFKVEGLKEENIIKNGKRIGVYYLGLTKKIWEDELLLIKQKYIDILNKFNIKMI